jgi:hypothetical protein
MIVGEAAGLEDYRTQLDDAAATVVIEVHKRKAGPGHRILQERDRRCPRQVMLAAQMQKSADQEMSKTLARSCSSSGVNRSRSRVASPAEEKSSPDWNWQ